MRPIAGTTRSSRTSRSHRRRCSPTSRRRSTSPRRSPRSSLHPYRPDFGNQLLPKLHSDLWSDWYGALERQWLTPTRVERVTASTQSVLGFLGDALALAGLAALAIPAAVRAVRRRAAAEAGWPTDLGLGLLAWVALATFAAFVFTVIRFPQRGGDPIKSSYLLFTAPCWAIFSVGRLGGGAPPLAEGEHAARRGGGTLPCELRHRSRRRARPARRARRARSARARPPSSARPRSRAAGRTHSWPCRRARQPRGEQRSAHRRAPRCSAWGCPPTRAARARAGHGRRRRCRRPPARMSWTELSVS